MEAGNSYGGLSSADLLERVAAHDGRAWEELVDRYVGLVWATTRNHGLSHEDAIDVGQTVWLKLSQNIGRIRDPERVGLWLQTTARNECIRLLNQRPAPSRWIPTMRSRRCPPRPSPSTPASSASSRTAPSGRPSPSCPSGAGCCCGSSSPIRPCPTRTSAT